MADTRTFIIGINGKLYVNQTPLTALPTMTEEGWQVLQHCTDITINQGKIEADITTRANDTGYEQTAGVLKSCSIETELIVRPDSEVQEMLEDAYESGTEIALAALTGDKAPTSPNRTIGIAGNFTVTDLSMTQSLREAMKYRITAKASGFTKRIRIEGT